MSTGVTGSIASATLSFLLLPHVQTSHRQFAASSPCCLRFPGVAFDLLSVEQPKGGGGDDEGETTFSLP